MARQELRLSGDTAQMTTLEAVARAIDCTGSSRPLMHEAGGGDSYTCIEWNRADHSKTIPCKRCAFLLAFGLT